MNPTAVAAQPLSLCLLETVSDQLVLCLTIQLRLPIEQQCLLFVE